MAGSRPTCGGPRGGALPILPLGALGRLLATRLGPSEATSCARRACRRLPLALRRIKFNTRCGEVTSKTTLIMEEVPRGAAPLAAGAGRVHGPRHRPDEVPACPPWPFCRARPRVPTARRQGGWRPALQCVAASLWLALCPCSRSLFVDKDVRAEGQVHLELRATFQCLEKQGRRTAPHPCCLRSAPEFSGSATACSSGSLEAGWAAWGARAAHGDYARGNSTTSHHATRRSPPAGAGRLPPLPPPPPLQSRLLTPPAPSIYVGAPGPWRPAHSSG